MRVGLVGAGFIGNVHLNAYAGMPGADVVGVADPDPEAAAAGAALVGAEAFMSYEEMVESVEPDLVDICVPTAFHRDLAVRAARDGLHVILEKPIARTLDDAAAIVEAFDGGGGRLFVGHVVRFFPEYAQIRQMIEDGELGRVGVVRTSRRSPFLRGWKDWYADRLASGGPMLDLVIHDFDFLRWSLGEVERVYARSSFGRGYGRHDYVLITLRMAGGAIAHVEGHWGYPAPFCYALEVAGSDALVTVDSTRQEALRVLLGEAAPVGRKSPDAAFGKSPYQLELEHFIRCARTGEEPVVSPEDAYEALRIGAAALESAGSGKAVSLR